MTGSIPACAGETSAWRNAGVVMMVYPRVCGGNFTLSTQTGSTAGLSPRVRGKPTVRCSPGMPTGSIPACAGETDSKARTAGTIEVYPRVCGGNRATNPPAADSTGLSPRVRGKP